MIETILKNNPLLQFVDLENEYKNTSSSITYICSEHGQQSRKALYLIEGRGCSKCASDAARKTKKTTQDFIKKSNEMHNEYYDYSKTVYTNSHHKLTITCPYHGDFEQLAYLHLKGSGCSSCGKISSSSKSYITTSTSLMTTLYYIKCYGNGEIFYKIGVTKNSVSGRYNKPEYMPYLYEVLREVTGKTEAILNLEKTIKLNLQLYSPVKSFGGSSTECTLHEIDLDQYLRML